MDKILCCWQSGDAAIFPTETVYGLGADAHNHAAVEKLYAIKSRSQAKAITVHVTDAAMAARYVEWSPAAQALAARFWPGPLTIVLKRKPGAGANALSGNGTLAVRAPAHPMAQGLIAAFGRGVAGTSANRSGHASPVTLAQARQELGGALLAIDGGRCEVGVSSTVIDLTGSAPRLLRAGSVTLESIETALTEAATTAASDVAARRDR